MDKIYIKDLEIFSFHGAIPEEKVLGQKFILSFELDIDLRKAGKNDDLTKTVHYGELAEKVEEEFTKTSYDLIEKAAEEICEFVLLNYPLVKKVKEIYPNKKIWSYSGYLFDEQILGKMAKEHIYTQEFLTYIDVLVDGKFILEEKSYDLHFRGSRNQRIIDVQKSLQEERVVLVEKYAEDKKISRYEKPSYMFI